VVLAMGGGKREGITVVVMAKVLEHLLDVGFDFVESLD
jgi:hypothetical protein